MAEDEEDFEFLDFDEEDFYSDNEIEKLLEDDEMSIEEGGFMQGYMHDLIEED